MGPDLRFHINKLNSMNLDIKNLAYFVIRLVSHYKKKIVNIITNMRMWTDVNISKYQ